MNKKHIWNILIFLSFFQYSQLSFSETIDENTKAAVSQGVPEGEGEKEWWEKAIDFFTGNDPLEEMRALNNDLKQLIEENQRIMEEIQRLRESHQRLTKSHQTLMEEISELKKNQQSE